MSINTIDAANQLLAENATLKAELKRRDAQKPVAWAHRLVNKHSGVVHPWVYGSSEKETSEGDIFCVEVIPLYAAAPAAVLPRQITSSDAPELAEISAEAARLGISGAYASFAVGANWMLRQCMAALNAPAAEPENVVKLPAEWDGTEHSEYFIGKQDGWNELHSRVIEALDAAGVKWVEGE